MAGNNGPESHALQLGYAVRTGKTEAVPAGVGQGSKRRSTTFLTGAKMHTSAGVYMTNPWPMETILLSVCLEQGRIIEKILEILRKRE